MARWEPITNLRSQIIDHPPVVLFFMCLLLLAGTFISIGIYSRNHDIKNPDIKLDWNQILGSLAYLKFCTQLNDTEIVNEKLSMNSRPLLDHEDELINNTQKNDVIIQFLLVPLKHVGDYPYHNSISATLLGSQLGLKGSAGKQSLNISLFFDIETRISTTDMQTKPQSYSSCLKITAPRPILPDTLLPPQCPSSKNLENDISTVNTLAVEGNKKSSGSSPCLRLEFTPDPKLTVLLTQEEKALARFHLLLVSIVLLAVCIMMCLFATFTCSKSHWQMANNPQKDSQLSF